MKSNGLLKWLAIPVLVLVAYLLIKGWSSHGSAHVAAKASSEMLTPAEMKALGIEGDTPRDTVATLVGQVKALRNEMQRALDDNQAQRAENERLHRRESDIDQRIQNAINGERDRLRDERGQAANDKQQAEGLLQDLERRLDNLDHKHAELPVGLGLRDGDGAGFDDGGMRWIEPQDKTPADGKHDNARPAMPRHDVAPDSFGPANDEHSPTQQTLEIGDTHAQRDEADSGKHRLHPVYTVPANATLIGSIAMTALIGRVPVDGTVNDPYPFKVLIGPDNLTANGVDVPDVAGAVVSGTASGDWTLSCVRGQIRSITFVFHDGTIRTLPSSRHDADTSGHPDGAESSSGNASVTQGGLGWISDPYGVPCVAGERRSNAEQYLGSQALITAAGAGAATLIPKGSDNVSYVSSNGSSLGTVGITGNEAMGRILAGGVQEMSQWVNKLYGQAFAAIYVKPGAKVAVHIDQPLTIDYDPKGRKVNHRTGDTHAPDLD